MIALELYNLAKDMGETVNLAERAPGKTKELNSLIDNFLRDTGAVMPRANPNWRGFRNWRAAPGASLTAQGGFATVTSDEGRPTLYLRDAPEKTGGKLTLKIRMRVIGEAENGILYWSTTNSPGLSNDCKLEFPIVKTPGWHVYSLDFTTTSPLKSMWLVGSTVAEKVRIDWIKLSREDGPLVKGWEFRTDGG